jgi:hypothetical protein
MLTRGRATVVVLIALLAVAGLLVLGTGGCDKGKSSGTTAAAAKPVGKFANAFCPIMGTKIDPKMVTANLTREYKGKKVAFCCEGCPVAWDKLTDEQKGAKLAAALKKK